MMGQSPRVLVTGAGGQLGGYLRPALERAGHEVIGLGHGPGTGVDIVADIGESDVVAAAVRDARPEVVIHCAAYTDVDGCERNPERAMRVNDTGSRNVAQAAWETGAWLLAVGTDFVFPGDATEPYREDAPVGPISVYGASKLAGERAVLAADHSFAVARTAWVFGGAGKHFPRTVVTMLRDRGTMAVVDDEVSCPTFAGDLAEALVALLPHRPSGVLHLTNEGPDDRGGRRARPGARQPDDDGRVPGEIPLAGAAPGLQRAGEHPGGGARRAPAALAGCGRAVRAAAGR